MNREATDLAGVRHKSYETLGSTNAEALARARDGERGPLWVTAKVQTAGRGRRGNAWVSVAGNLFATLLFTPSRMDVAPQLSFVAALAAHDAITNCAPQLKTRTTLKWPNDLLIDGKKAAGLLLEAESMAVAIGFGINCAAHPTDTEYPATDLKAEGVPLDIAALAAALSAAMQRRVAEWDNGAGFTSIRADWLARAGGIDGRIRVRLPDRELQGQFRGLDDDGRLLLESGGTVEVIAAGDVFPLMGVQQS